MERGREVGRRMEGKRREGERREGRVWERRGEWIGRKERRERGW